MCAKLANLYHCAVPFLSRAAVNLCWYDSATYPRTHYITYSVCYVSIPFLASVPLMVKLTAYAIILESFKISVLLRVQCRGIYYEGSV